MELFNIIVNDPINSENELQNELLLDLWIFLILYANTRNHRSILNMYLEYIINYQS